MTSVLSFEITNQSGSDIYLYVQASTANCDISYLDSSNSNAKTKVTFTGSNVLSDPIAFSNINNGTLTINECISGVFFFTYGSMLATSATPPIIQNSTVPFSVVEITRNNPSVAGDAGDLTAINFFTAPIKLKSFDSSGNLLQEKSFSQSTAEIFSQLYALAPGATVINNGTPIRVLSAYEYATQQLASPYQTFDNYLASISTSAQQTTIQNSSAWNNPANTSSGNYTNYAFEFTFTAAVAQNSGNSYYDIELTDGTIQVTSITYTKQIPSSPVTTSVASNLAVTLSGSDDALLNQLIYGQTINDAASFTDSGTNGWSALKTYISSNVPNQNVFDTLQSLIIGEITSGFVFGFIDSDETPVGQTTEIKNMPSNQWWGLNPNDGYSAAQPDNAYYDPYAAVICATSGNQVYGAAYGDRFTNPTQNPTIESSYYNGQAVATWKVTLLPPITFIPTVLATLGAVMEGGVILEVQVMNPGSGYIVAPVVTIESPGNGGMTAQAVATISNGEVTEVTVTNSGSQYTFSPQVSLTVEV